MICSTLGFTPSMTSRPQPTHLTSTKEESIFDQQVDDMFAKYDKDGNGFIDKEEFRAVAQKMKSSSRRREVLSVATATFGSLFVASGSNTFQFAQKRLRSGYLEELAEDAQNKLFPTAMLSSDVDKAISNVLTARGFTPENTLFGHSVCADEVNNRKEQLIPLMVNRWQEGMSLVLSVLCIHIESLVYLLLMNNLYSPFRICSGRTRRSTFCW